MTAAKLPVFPAFAWDDYFWVTSASLPSWTGYRVANRVHGEDTIQLVFAPEGRDDAPLMDSEIDLVRWVVENQARVHDAMLQRLFDEYPRLRAEYLDCFVDEKSAKERLPQVDTPADLKPLLEIVSINVHQIDSSERPYIGVELACTWDDEHGVGMLLHGTDPLEVGSADTAILLWIAEKYANERKDRRT